MGTQLLESRETSKEGRCTLERVDTARYPLSTSGNGLRASAVKSVKRVRFVVTTNIKPGHPFERVVRRTRWFKTKREAVAFWASLVVAPEC